MKKTFKKSIRFAQQSTSLFSLILFFAIAVPVNAQEEIKDKKEEKAEKPARPAFESAWWFDGQTGVVYNKNTFEYVIQHRFGVMNSGNRDLGGIYGPSNIRMGLAYTPINKLSVGLGLTKNKMILDLNAKYAILTQTKSNSMPISLTYYGNMGIETLEKENYLNASDRYNYFNQLIIMRRFGSKFSAQLAPSYTHYNVTKWEQQADESWERMENDAIAVSAGMRYKFNSQLILMLGFDQSITNHAIHQPKPSIN
ncbi:MAG: DUF5777 family beta-barrel protein, partial [Cyclobacteriaceae bacterium]|nr:DUF5777 family beta-barrel protein [Cyclobacteriaceae bacterium]